MMMMMMEEETKGNEEIKEEKNVATMRKLRKFRIFFSRVADTGCGDEKLMTSLESGFAINALLTVRLIIDCSM